MQHDEVIWQVWPPPSRSSRQPVAQRRGALDFPVVPYARTAHYVLFSSLPPACSHELSVPTRVQMFAQPRCPLHRVVHPTCPPHTTCVAVGRRRWAALPRAARAPSSSNTNRPRSGFVLLTPQRHPHRAGDCTRPLLVPHEDSHAELLPQRVQRYRPVQPLVVPAGQLALRHHQGGQRCACRTAGSVCSQPHPAGGEGRRERFRRRPPPAPKLHPREMQHAS